MQRYASLAHLLFIAVVAAAMTSPCNALRNVAAKKEQRRQLQEQQLKQQQQQQQQQDEQAPPCYMENHPQFLLQVEDFVCSRTGQSNLLGVSPQTPITSVLRNPASYHSAMAPSEARCAVTILSELLDSLQSETQRLFHEDPEDEMVLQNLCNQFGMGGNAQHGNKDVARMRFLRQSRQHRVEEEQESGDLR